MSRATWHAGVATICCALACCVLLDSRVSVAAQRLASEDDGVSERWSAALEDLVSDPELASRELRRLARLEGMPESPRVLVALGYAYQRARRPAAAREAWRLVTERDRDADDAWTARAHLALGWAALSARDPERATQHFSAATDGVNDSAAALGRLMAERVESAFGLGASYARLTQLAADPSASRDIRLAAQLELAYAYFWNGSFTAAIDAFETLAAAAPASVVFDDAEYGSALARWASGDAVGARQRWSDLADRGGNGKRSRLSPRGVALDARALTARLARRARELPPGDAETAVLSLYDEDGSALARSALAILVRQQEAPATLAIAPERLDVTSAADFEDSRSVSRDLGHKPSGSDGGPVVLLELALNSWVVALALGVVVIIIGCGAGVRPRDSRRDQRKTPSAASTAISSSARPRMSR